MHSAVVLLVQAENKEDAVFEAENFMDQEVGHAFDYYSIEDNNWGDLIGSKEKEEFVLPLSECKDKVIEYSKSKDLEIEYFQSLADQYKKAGDNQMYGFALKHLGEIIGEYFTPYAGVYNIDMSDYSIPDNTDDWWAVVADMHH